MIPVLNSQSWSVLSKGELTYTFMWILKRMWHWSSHRLLRPLPLLSREDGTNGGKTTKPTVTVGQLTPEYLHPCCATQEFFGNNSVDSNQ